MLGSRESRESLDAEMVFLSDSGEKRPCSDSRFRTKENKINTQRKNFIEKYCQI